MLLKRNLYHLISVGCLCAASLFLIKTGGAQNSLSSALQYHYQAASELRKEKRYDDALKELESVLAQVPNHDKSLALAATMYRATGRYELCQQFAKRAIECNPTVGWYYATYAFGAYQNHDFVLAYPALQKVVAMGPDRVQQGNFSLAQTYLKELESKHYIITWDIKPLPKMIRNGSIGLPAPVTDLPYQRATWEIKGARRWHTTQENGNTMIQVEPEGDAPFQFIVDATVKPYSFKVEMAKSSGNSLPEETRPFLETSRKVDRGHKILEVAAIVKAAQPLATIQNTVRWLEDNFTYERGSFKSAEEAITRGYGDCGAFSTIFTALCQANGIPARNLWGVTKASQEFTPEGHLSGHVWAEFYLSGYGWVPVEPQSLYKIGYIGTNRVLFYRGTSRTNSVSISMSRAVNTYTPAYIETPANDSLN